MVAAKLVRPLIVALFALAACRHAPPPADPTPVSPPPTPTSTTPPPATAPAGASCTADAQCASKMCEGLGCDDAHPGHCVDPARICTMDEVAYCGCDGKTFMGSSGCPDHRYAKRGACE